MTIEKIFLRFLTTRIGVSQVNVVGFALAIQETVPTTGAPVTVINPLDTSQDNFTLGLKQLIMTGLLPVPPVVLQPSDDAKIVNNSNMLTQYEFNGRRKYNRMNHALTLTVNADVDAMVRMFFQARILLRFS